MLICKYTNNAKLCNKKYKTKHGLEKHYVSVHKDIIMKHNPNISFDNYMDSYVKNDTENVIETQVACVDDGGVDNNVNNGSDNVGNNGNNGNNVNNGSDNVGNNGNNVNNGSESVGNNKIRLLEDQNKLLLSQNKIFDFQLSDIKKRLSVVEKRNKRYCLVCWNNESNYALIPCGHKIVCGDCSVSILGGKRECPVCSEKVYDLLQIWESGYEESE